MASAGAGGGLRPKVDPLGVLSPIPGGGPAVTPGAQPPEMPPPLTGGFCNGIEVGFAQANPGMTVYQQASPIPTASPPGTPGWQPSCPPNAAGQGFGTAVVAPATTVFNNTPQSWYIRKTGSDFNGGSSPNVLASGSTGQTYGVGAVVPSAGRGAYRVFTDASASFTNSLVGHWMQVSIANVAWLFQITQVLDSHTLLYRVEVANSNVNPGATSGLSYVIGGAWQTWSMAFTASHNVGPNRNSKAAPLAPGDTVYVGAGVYRELVTMQQSGTLGAPIKVVGDVTGQYTGDAAGVVQLTSWLDDTGAGGTLGSSATLTLAGGVNWVTFSNIAVMSAANTNVFASAGAGIILADCTVISLANGTAVSMSTPGAAGLVQNCGCQILRCTIYGASGVSVGITGTANQLTTETDLNIVIKDSLIFALSGNPIFTNGIPSTRIQPGGVRIYNCTLVAASNTSPGVAVQNVSTAIPWEVHGCVLIGNGNTALSAANALGQIIESYNVLIGWSTLRSRVPVGPGSTVGGQASPGLLNWGQNYKAGLELLVRPFLSPLPGGAAAAIGAQPAEPPGVAGLRQGYAVPSAPLQTAAYPNAAAYPTLGVGPTDWLERVRPSGVATLGTPGYVELHDSAEEDTTTYYDTPASAVLIGPGDQELRIPVDAVSNTISIQVLYDSNYGGTNPPQIVLVAAPDINVPAATASAPAGNPGNWQQVTLPAFTPSQAGWVQVRLISYDTSGISRVNFDTLSVA